MLAVQRPASRPLRPSHALKRRPRRLAAQSRKLSHKDNTTTPRRKTQRREQKCPARRRSQCRVPRRQGFRFVNLCKYRPRSETRQKFGFAFLGAALRSARRVFLETTDNCACDGSCLVRLGKACSVEHEACKTIVWESNRVEWRRERSGRARQIGARGARGASEGSRALKRNQNMSCIFKAMVQIYLYTI